MFKEIVEVIDVTDTTVSIKFSKRSSCSCCKFTHICNVDAREILQIPNPKNIVLKKGDKIEVGIEESKNIIAVCLLFLIPAVLFFLTLVFTRRWESFLSFSVAILTLMLYYLCIKIILGNKDKNFSLRILRKI